MPLPHARQDLPRVTLVGMGRDSLAAGDIERLKPAMQQFDCIAKLRIYRKHS